MFVCAGNNENFSFAKSIGIGLIHSAINLTTICAKEPIKEIIFVGTAGSYSYDINLLEIYSSTKATQIESGLIRKDSYTPIDNQIENKYNVSYETKSAITNSSNYITTNFQISKQFLDLGIELENMEFFSVLKVAEFFDIKCSGIFCVTNYCDKNAHKNFIDNHQIAKQKLQEFICQYHKRD